METIYVVVIKDGLVVDVSHFAERDKDKAEEEFCFFCDQYLSDFDEYDGDDIAALLETGSCHFGNGSIQMHREI